MQDAARRAARPHRRGRTEAGVTLGTALARPTTGRAAAGGPGRDGF